MSYLSTFLGANAQGYSAFKGLPNRLAGYSYFDFGQYMGGNVNSEQLSWNATDNDFAPSFYTGSTRGATMYGWSQVTGLGNARFEAAAATWQFNYDDTQVINTINCSACGGATGTFTRTSGSSLTAIYNLGIRGKYGGITFSPFTNNSQLSTITISEISFSAFYTSSVSFASNALSAQSVENILVAADAGSPNTLGGGSINLSGGTNSGAGALTAAAAAARTSLIAKGCTITLNP